jgi:hypothetical protein
VAAEDTQAVQAAVVRPAMPCAEAIVRADMCRNSLRDVCVKRHTGLHSAQNRSGAGAMCTFGAKICCQTRTSLGARLVPARVRRRRGRRGTTAGAGRGAGARAAQLRGLHVAQLGLALAERRDVGRHVARVEVRLHQPRELVGRRARAAGPLAVEERAGHVQVLLEVLRAAESFVYAWKRCSVGASTRVLATTITSRSRFFSFVPACSWRCAAGAAAAAAM